MSGPSGRKSIISFGKKSNPPFLCSAVVQTDPSGMTSIRFLGKQHVQYCMLALDVYLNILLGYELLFVFLRKGKQSAIAAHGDGLSRQTLRF